MVSLDHHDHEGHHYFPPEIIVQILARLPVKSLMRFMCVDKSWYSLIKSPTFITTHLTKNKTKVNFLLFHYDFYLSQLCEKTLPKSYYSLYSVVDHGTICLQFYDNLTEFDGMPMDSHIYGTSNGLICLSNCELTQDSIIHLWNPAIRKVKTLPVTPLVSSKYKPRSVSLAFGFLPKINDYKVVKFLKSSVIDSPSLVVEIYSLSTNSWKQIVDVYADNDVWFQLSDLNSKATFVNGASYWIHPLERKLLCFDMESEMIREILLPDQLQGYPNHKFINIVDVYAFGESLMLCDLLYDVDVGGVSSEFWVLEREGVNEEVWTKCTSSPENTWASNVCK